MSTVDVRGEINVDRCFSVSIYDTLYRTMKMCEVEALLTFMDVARLDDRPVCSALKGDRRRFSKKTNIALVARPGKRKSRGLSSYRRAEAPRCAIPFVHVIARRGATI